MAAAFHPWRGPACGGVLVQQLDSTAEFAPRQSLARTGVNKVGEVVRIAGALGIFHLQQLAAVVEGPAMEGASVSGLVGPLVPAEHGAAVAAGVDEGVQLAIAVA